MRFRLAHEFDVSPEKFWSVFFIKAYNEELYKQLHFHHYELLEFEEHEQGRSMKRVQKLEPGSSLPSWASSLIPSMAYTEYNLYNKQKSNMEVNLESALLKDRFWFQGIYQVSPLPNQRCFRDFVGEVKISVPLLGGKLEKLVIEQLQAAEPTVIQVTKKWLALFHKESIAQ